MTFHHQQDDTAGVIRALVGLLSLLALGGAVLLLLLFS
jgi:hypothetical protein